MSEERIKWHERLIDERPIDEESRRSLPYEARLEAAHKWFKDNGVNASRWAVERGFTPAALFDLLAGRTLALRGQAFEIAVALGVIDPPKAEIRQ